MQIIHVSRGRREQCERRDRLPGLCTPENIVWEILHEGDAAIHVATQVLVDLPGNEKPVVGWNVAVFEYDVTGVVRSQLSEGKIALAHQNLLDPSVTPSV